MIKQHAYYIILVVCVVISIAYFARRHRNIPTKDKWIVVVPMWGLCNRLRTLRVAYDLSQASGRRLAVVDDSDSEFDTMFDGRLRDLFTSPHIEFWSRSDLSRIIHHPLHYNVQNDCSLSMRLDEFTRLQDKDILSLHCCGLSITGLNETNRFYESIIPTNIVRQRIQKTLDEIMRTNAIGVHIRQGTIADLNKSIFFGEWTEERSNMLPVFCCNERFDTSSCPDSAPRLERFVEAMRQEGSNKTFFICSDRPGCFLSLEQIFNKRILYNAIEVEYTANALNAFCDWYCLSHCSKIIASGVSSFSSEATKMKGLLSKSIHK